MASPRPPLPPVTRAVRCSASIAATRLAWCVLVLCRGPHSSPLFENILERQYRIALAYSLRDRFLPILNGFLQALGESCLVLDSDLCPRGWRSPAIAGRFPASGVGCAAAVPGSP